MRVILLILSGAFLGATSDGGSAIAIALLVIHILIFVLFAYVSIRRLSRQCCKKKDDPTTIPSSSAGSASSGDIELNVTTSSHGNMLSSSQQSDDITV